MTVDRYADVLGVRTRYVDVGEGPPVVLIHGGEPGSTASSDSWRCNIDALAAAGHRVIAPDRIGNGRTANPATDDGFRMGNLCAHVAQLLEDLGVDGATVVGQSRGAFVAAHIALTHPRLVDRLVIVNSASLSPAYGAFHSPVQANILGGPDNVRHDAEWYAVVHENITDEWVERTAQMLRDPERVATRTRMSSFKSTYLDDLDQEKAKLLGWLRSGSFTKPTAIIWGIGDPSTSLKDAVDLFEIFAGGGASVRMHVISNCGHSPFFEYPDEFNAVLLGFTRTPPEAFDRHKESRG